MKVENISDFDDLKVALLKLLSAPFGVAGQTVVAIYVAWGVNSSYIRATKNGVRFSEAVRDWFVWQHQRQSGEFWYAATTTVVMLAMQLVWLGCAVVMGGLLSRFIASWNDDDQPLGAPGEALLPIQWDSISKAYVLICIISLLGAYVLARRKVKPTGLFVVCGLPGLFWGTFGAVGASLTTVAYFVGLDLGIDSFEPLLSIWILVAVGFVFLGITHVALNAPSFIGKVWSSPEDSVGEVE